MTAADRAKIAAYRKKKPEAETTFTKSEDLDGWTLETDDKWNLKSCRLPANIVTSASGLDLQTLDAGSKCHAKWSTGAMEEKTTRKYGFFEASIKIADITGINNAFWITTDDKYAINVEVHYPNEAHLSVQDWNGSSTGVAVGFETKYNEDLSKDFHDYGILWTSSEIVFTVDGEPVSALVTKDSFAGNGNLRISTAIIDFAGKTPPNPAGHDMLVRSLKIWPK
jgi:beta-glucanase (GH16 family)